MHRMYMLYEKLFIVMFLLHICNHVTYDYARDGLIQKSPANMPMRSGFEAKNK